VKPLHPARPITDDRQSPGPVHKLQQGGRQTAKTRELVAGPHHRDRDQFRRLTWRTRLSRRQGRRHHEKGRKIDHPSNATCHDLDLLAISRRDRDVHGRAPDSVADRPLPRGPVSVVALGGVRCLGSEIRDRQSRRHRRPDQIRRFVVGMIGEPHIGAPFSGRTAILRQQSFSLRGSGDPVAGENGSRRVFAETAQARCKPYIAARRTKRHHKLPRHQPITRRHVIVRRLHRRIKGDAHAGVFHVFLSAQCAYHQSIVMTQLSAIPWVHHRHQLDV